MMRLEIESLVSLAYVQATRTCISRVYTLTFTLTHVSIIVVIFAIASSLPTSFPLPFYLMGKMSRESSRPFN